jgi:gas vesicle protein
MGKKNSNTWLWAIAGLGIGLAAGLLATPEKGEVMRARLKKKARIKLDELLESVEESLEEAWKKAVEEEEKEEEK